jgi:hypothetical protein
LTYASTCGALIVLRQSAGPAPTPIPFGPTLAVIALVATATALASTSGAAVRDVTIALAVGWIGRTLTQRLRPVAVATMGAPSPR